MDIENRIKELESEVSKHREDLEKAQVMSNQLQTAIISKSGAIMELKKLVAGGEE